MMLFALYLIIIREIQGTKNHCGSKSTKDCIEHAIIGQFSPMNVLDPCLASQACGDQGHGVPDHAGRVRCPCFLLQHRKPDLVMNELPAVAVEDLLCLSRHTTRCPAALSSQTWLFRCICYSSGQPRQILGEHSQKKMSPIVEKVHNFLDLPPP